MKHLWVPYEKRRLFMPSGQAACGAGMGDEWNEGPFKVHDPHDVTCRSCKRTKAYQKALDDLVHQEADRPARCCAGRGRRVCAWCSDPGTLPG